MRNTIVRGGIAQLLDVGLSFWRPGFDPPSGLNFIPSSLHVQMEYNGLSWADKLCGTIKAVRNTDHTRQTWIHMQTPLSPLAGCGPVDEGTSGKVLNWTVRSLNHAYTTNTIVFENETHIICRNLYCAVCYNCFEKLAFGGIFTLHELLQLRRCRTGQLVSWNAVSWNQFHRVTVLKNVMQGTFQSPVQLFYDRALLYSCNVFHETFFQLANHIPDYFSPMGKTNFYI